MDKIPDRVSVGDHVLYQEIGDEIVLLDLQSNQYYGLDAVGAEVWRLLAEISEPGVVAERMKEIYDADPAQIQNDVQVLVSELVHAGLLRDTA